MVLGCAIWVGTAGYFIIDREGIKSTLLGVLILLLGFSFEIWGLIYGGW
jgi:hypothetical protein